MVKMKFLLDTGLENQDLDTLYISSWIAIHFSHLSAKRAKARTAFLQDRPFFFWKK
jgi:hypothetical protein